MPVLTKAAGERVKNLLALALLGVSVLFAGNTLYSKSIPGRNMGPVALERVIGTSMDSVRFMEQGDSDWRLWKPSPGGTILYLFATTCAACSHQRPHIESLAASLPPGKFVSASTEPLTQTEGYWRAGLPRALQVRQHDIVGIGVAGVPTLVVVDGKGEVVSAWMGSILAWDAPRFLEELRRAGP